LLGHAVIWATKPTPAVRQREADHAVKLHGVIMATTSDLSRPPRGPFYPAIPPRGRCQLSTARPLIPAAVAKSTAPSRRFGAAEIRQHSRDGVSSGAGAHHPHPRGCNPWGCFAGRRPARGVARQSRRARLEGRLCHNAGCEAEPRHWKIINSLTASGGPRLLARARELVVNQWAYAGEMPVRPLRQILRRRSSPRR